ncbi:hypothetical protein XFF6990_430114 [Xanthomonas citri pv. fuscans]|uniref:Uncharacterized protein n=1 Tax=Xanthomonas campestris pv. phaseoli TaxID=317013 RepID=A0A7Z7J026_XANCH|nr:hypothetical protein XFF6990_430114 [Xanthomonas citri pv. fuscans]SOO24803.1 hypothetical protein XFF6991_420020 [Xanthomonas phaseoli pv. phaseoli]
MNQNVCIFDISNSEICWQSFGYWEIGVNPLTKRSN